MSLAYHIEKYVDKEIFDKRIDETHREGIEVVNIKGNAEQNEQIWFLVRLETRPVAFVVGMEAVSATGRFVAMKNKTMMIGFDRFVAWIRADEQIKVDTQTFDQSFGGFFCFVELEDGDVIAIFETGIARLTFAGRTVWQTRLNDLATYYEIYKKKYIAIVLASKRTPQVFRLADGKEKKLPRHGLWTRILKTLGLRKRRRK